MSMRVPTDIAILEVIYSTYYDAFCKHGSETENRDSKVYVPVDLKAVAEKLSVDPDIIFGRLYYYLEEKYGYQRKDGSSVCFFTLQAGKDRHCVNFPLLASVLASLQSEHSRFRLSLTISIISLVVSSLSLVLSGAAKLLLGS